MALTYQDILSMSNIKELYLSKVIITTDNECWNWQGHFDEYGYGKISISYNNLYYTISAHRLSYFLFNGDIGKGLVVRHICHNRVCSNPKHLITGTYKENMDDCVISGRVSHKLAEEDVITNIIPRIKAGEYCSVIARDFGVNESTITDIRKGRTWKHLTGGKIEVENPKAIFGKLEKIAYEKGYRMDKVGIIYGSKGKRVNGWIDNRGYLKFGIRTSKNKDRQLQAHRLQAYQKFGDKIYDPKLIVRHLNNNPLDNSWDNIELGTKAENRMDMSQEDRIKSAQLANSSKRKLTPEQLKEFWIDHIVHNFGCRKLSIKYNITDSCALDIINYKNYAEESKAIVEELLATKNKTR
jgi:HNH endonuclease